LYCILQWIEPLTAIPKEKLLRQQGRRFIGSDSDLLEWSILLPIVRRLIA
jgi:hypothetical protein